MSSQLGQSHANRPVRAPLGVTRVRRGAPARNSGLVDPWADDAPAVAPGNRETETGTSGEPAMGQVPLEKASVSP